MVQNHILQILSLLAMEPPVAFLKNYGQKKIKALNAIRIYSEEEVKQHFVRGQYDKGQLEDKKFVGYREEANVDEESATETFVAGKFDR